MGLKGGTAYKSREETGIKEGRRGQGQGLHGNG